MDDETLKSLLSKIDKQLEKIDAIYDYVVAHSQKNTEEDINKCYSFLQNNDYITTDFIKQDSVLKLKYPQYTMQKRLLDGLLNKYPDLKEEKTGQGNKRYIYKKENEEIVKTKIKLSKNKTVGFGRTSDINHIKEQLQEKHLGKRFSAKMLHDLFPIEFNIKTKSKIVATLKMLKMMGVLVKVDDLHFEVKNNRK